MRCKVLGYKLIDIRSTYCLLRVLHLCPIPPFLLKTNVDLFQEEQQSPLQHISASNQAPLLLDVLKLSGLDIIYVSVDLQVFPEVGTVLENLHVFNDACFQTTMTAHQHQVPQK